MDPSARGARDVRRQHRGDAGTLLERPLPGGPAPRHQPQRRLALRDPVLPRAEPRRGRRTRPDLGPPRLKPTTDGPPSPDSPPSTACQRAKRLPAATSVAASRSSLPISASTRAMISLDTAAAGFVGTVSERETVLIRARSVSFNPAGLRSTSRSDSRWTSTSTASTAVSFSSASRAMLGRWGYAWDRDRLTRLTLLTL